MKEHFKNFPTWNLAQQEVFSFQSTLHSFVLHHSPDVSPPRAFLWPTTGHLDPDTSGAGSHSRPALLKILLLVLLLPACLSLTQWWPSDTLVCSLTSWTVHWHHAPFLDTVLLSLIPCYVLETMFFPWKPLGTLPWHQQSFCGTFFTSFYEPCPYCTGNGHKVHTNRKGSKNGRN